MYGCTEQKYWNAPGVVKVNENLSPVSSLFDLKSFVLEATVCVVPGNGRAGLHSDALRNEGVLVDFYLRIRGLRRRGGKGERGREDGDRKHGRDPDVNLRMLS
jgi:hypothetical protein